jgi:hypothetical protein
MNSVHKSCFYKRNTGFIVLVRAMEEKFRERLPITEWPDLERKMGIISRMTSDPPPDTESSELSG